MKKHYKKLAALVCLVFMLGNLKIFALADSQVNIPLRQENS